MNDIPETRYAKSGDCHIAYQVVGKGPLDLVFIPGFVSHVEHGWDDPRLAHFYRRLASFARLILFDKRGTGMSDPVPIQQRRRSSNAWTTCARSWTRRGRSGRRWSVCRKADR